MKTRRDFIKSTGIAAIGAGIAARLPGQPSALPDAVPLKTRVLGPGERIGIGIIGCGNRSRTHVASIRQVPEVEIRGLCDILPEALASRIREVRGATPATYLDYHEMLADPRIDAVVVSTPNDTHRDPVIAALNAGKHVYCEKPMALQPADCDAMIAAQRRSGRVLLIGTQRRHTPAHMEFTRRIHDGAIGQVLSAWMNDFRRDWRRMFKTEEEEIRGNWRYSNARSGGLTFEMSIHGIDHCNWIMQSEPVEVVAMGGIHNPKLRKRDSSDHIGFTVRYANGAQLVYGASLYSSGGYGPDVITGADGSAVADGGTMIVRRADYGQLGGRAPGPAEEKFELPKGNGNVGIHRHFVDAIQGRVTPTADGFDGKRGVQIARAVETSAREKRYVRIAELG